MSLSTATALHEAAYTLNQPAAVYRRDGLAASVVNIPDDPKRQGVVGFTPQLSQLIDDAWPLIWHQMDRIGATASLPLYFFYVNPRDPVADNAAALLSLLTSCQGRPLVWAPLSTSHATILHTLRLILPELSTLDLQQATLLYVGDNANRAPLQAMAKQSRIPFSFHALY